MLLASVYVHENELVASAAIASDHTNRFVKYRSKRAIDQDEFDVEHSISVNLVLDMDKYSYLP